MGRVQVTDLCLQELEKGYVKVIFFLKKSCIHFAAFIIVTGMHHKLHILSHPVTAGLAVQCCPNMVP